MLDLMTSSKSSSVIFRVIEALTGDTTYASFTGVITAKVNGVKVIDREEITVQLINSRPNYATIDIMWEDCGYKSYKNLGLYGQMTTQWQEVKKAGERAFKIIGDNYEIKVRY